MSPRQTSFLTEGAESLALSAQELRHFEGMPFEVDVTTTMPFYGTTFGDKSRQHASKVALGTSRSADGIKTRPRAGQATAARNILRSRSVSPPRRPDTTAASTVYDSDSRHARKTSKMSLVWPTEKTARASSPPAKKKHRPNALSFLDPDSPAITKERITRAVAESVAWRPQRGSAPRPMAEAEAPPPLIIASSSDDSKPPSLTGSENDSDISTDTEASDNGENGENGDNGDERTPKPTLASGLDLNMPDFSSVALAMEPPKLNYPGLPINPYPQRHSQHTVYPRAHSRTQPQTKAHLSAQQRKYRAYRYGTPEMSRGNANLPHIPPSALNPRVPATGHVKHLPRAEKLPLTGYELLASQLSSHSSHIMKFRRGSMGAASTQSTQSTWSSGSGPGSSNGSTGSGGGSTGMQTPHFPIKPLYRKFEALNHRILLHLQDELSELEEQLHRLDTADTQTRRLQNSILPASRRAEVLTGGELQWHKTDVLGKIGYKLGQYNHVLSSFTETQRLASPTLSDISDYRSYLDTQQPIAEIETRFLDASDDLVTLATSRHKRAQLADGSSGLSSPSSSLSGSGACLSSSPSYLQSLSEEPMDMTAAMGRSGHMFPGLRRSNPSSPAPSSTSESSESSVLLSHSSRATTAIFEKEEAADITNVELVHTTGLMRSDYPTQSMPTEGKGNTVSTTKEETTPTVRSTLASDDVLHLIIAMAVAVIVPVLTFTLIPGVAGRMAVVLLVAFTVFGAQVQAGTIRVAHDNDATTNKPGQNSRDLLCCAAVYGAVMAVVANVCS